MDGKQTQTPAEALHQAFEQLKATTDRERETVDPLHAGGVPARVVTERPRKAGDVIAPLDEE